MLTQVFEFGMLLLFALCIADALLKGRKRLRELFGAALAGLTLEVLAVIYLRIYEYGTDFWVTVFGVPVCIGLGWGIVVYISLGLCDNLNLGRDLRPVIAGIIGLNIDLAMDVVAIRIGLWHWYFPGLGPGEGSVSDALTFGGFFGVPYLNFIVWFVFVYVCSMTIIWARNGGPAGWKKANPVHKLEMAVTGAFDNLLTGSWKAFTTLLLCWRTDFSKELKMSPGKFEPVSFVVVTSIHIFFLGVLIYFQSFGIIWLTVISAAMLVAGLVLHLLPILHYLRSGVSHRKPSITALLTGLMRL